MFVHTHIHSPSHMPIRLEFLYWPAMGKFTYYSSKQEINKLHIVSMPLLATQDRAGLLDQFVKSLPVSCGDAAAPADHCREDGWCHNSVKEGPEERFPQQVESALTFPVKCMGVMSPVQFFVQVNTQVLKSPLSLCPFPGCSPVSGGLDCACRNPLPGP